MEIIKNINGKEYQIIAKHGEYTLVEQVGNREVEYIVAWCLQETSEGYIWAQGHYFDEIWDAMEYMNKIYGGSEI